MLYRPWQQPASGRKKNKWKKLRRKEELRMMGKSSCGKCWSVSLSHIFLVSQGEHICLKNAKKKISLTSNTWSPSATFVHLSFYLSTCLASWEMSVYACLFFLFTCLSIYLSFLRYWICEISVSPCLFIFPVSICPCDVTCEFSVHTFLFTFLPVHYLISSLFTLWYKLRILRPLLPTFLPFLPAIPSSLPTCVSTLSYIPTYLTYLPVSMWYYLW